MSHLTSRYRGFCKTPRKHFQLRREHITPQSLFHPAYFSSLFEDCGVLSIHASRVRFISMIILQADRTENCPCFLNLCKDAGDHVGDMVGEKKSDPRRRVSTSFVYPCVYHKVKSNGTRMVGGKSCTAAPPRWTPPEAGMSKIHADGGLAKDGVAGRWLQSAVTTKANTRGILLWCLKA